MIEAADPPAWAMERAMRELDGKPVRWEALAALVAKAHREGWEAAIGKAKSMCGERGLLVDLSAIPYQEPK